MMNNRYDRHNLIPDWRQEALADATVVVMGMGALGNEATRILAMTGAGKLIICDPDRVEDSNLSRTLLFRRSDIGRFKVEAAAEALERLAPGLIVQPRPQPLVHGVGMAELRDATIVLGCLDSRSARLQLAGRCQMARAAYIDGATHPWGGEVRPYLNPDGPCYGCSLSVEERAVVDAPWSCLDVIPETAVGAAAPSSALVGTWMGMIAVRFLMGLPCPPGALSIDASRGTTIIVKQERDPECPLHHPLGAVARLNLGSQDTAGQMRRSLPADAVPLLWEPAQERVECPQCGFSEERWALPSLAECPQCGHTLRPRTTLELDQAPYDLKLSDLGIAPREILAVRTQDGLLWVELAE